ncbi:hypothetical protein FKM82_025505 [Ascaphus truei]
MKGTFISPLILISFLFLGRNIESRFIFLTLESSFFRLFAKYPLSVNFFMSLSACSSKTSISLQFLLNLVNCLPGILRIQEALRLLVVYYLFYNYFIII